MIALPNSSTITSFLISSVTSALASDTSLLALTFSTSFLANSTSSALAKTSAFSASSFVSSSNFSALTSSNSSDNSALGRYTNYCPGQHL